ncbi:MAG TPA: hypothetical protein ENH37_13470 [Deltaproteobacteria bacterium]|nr:hypothetical protein [Deltaproteobacteria bacterium]
MEPVRFVQCWDPVIGRKQEYATFVGEEFWPCMKASGLEVTDAWHTLVGGWPHVVAESPAGSLDQVQRALGDPGLTDMLGRFRNLVTGYSNLVIEPAPWGKACRETPSSGADVKLIQAWEPAPGGQGTFDRFMRDLYIPGMGALGLEVSSGWRLMVGSGFRFYSESFGPDPAAVSKVMGSEDYLRIMAKMEELVIRYETRILLRYQIFLHVLHEVHGRAIREVLPDETRSMVGPAVWEGRE